RRRPTARRRKDVRARSSRRRARIHSEPRQHRQSRLHHLMRRGGRAIPIVTATIALVVLTCAYTWPLLLTARSSIHDDSNDPLLVTWMLWWSTRAVPLTAQWWNGPAVFPATG